MTAKEWNEASEYLENSEAGCYVKNRNRTVEIVEMCGGRYLFIDDNGVCGLEDEVWRALEFLKSGRTFVNGKVYQH